MSEPNRFSTDAQRYLDGEPHGEVSPEERAVADRLRDGTTAYAERLQVPGAEVDRAVMRTVRGLRPARRRMGWRWLVQPQAIQVRPIWVPAIAALLVALVWLGTSRDPVTTAAPVPAVAASDTIFVHFELRAPDAELVSVAGSFNQWRPGALPLTRRNGGVWSATIPLPVGEHQYQFVIDGTEWIPDPTAHAQIDDGFGGTNSLIVVGPKGVVRS
ncbi:MAG: isoamylase early set domain-containing protein [Gemmatimonadales bacterium]